MARPPHDARWSQASLLDDAPPPSVDLPPEMRQDAVSALAELLRAHLAAIAAADPEERDEREAES
jgi:hypothetical protein